MFFNFIFLFYNYIFNGKSLDSDFSLYNNIYFSYGLKKNAVSYVENRLEKNLHNNLKSLKKFEWELYLNCIYDIVPFKCSLLRRLTFNIFMLDIITSYRGWRHYRGLPVRGQRTWTNSWSCYKSNWVLRNYKVIASKKNYGNIPIKDIKVASVAEYVNLIWKQQWDFEWLAAKNSRLRFKGNKNTIKIDIYAMANYQVMHPLKLKNLSKKQKQSFKKNYFSLGFDPGFTKQLFQELHNVNTDQNNQGLSSSSLILKDGRASKKNSPKKKTEVNKKLKKKIKKSVWD